MHFKFGQELKIIRIIGGMFNYCITNSLLNIAKAQIDANINELIVEFPVYYVFTQRLGAKESLSVEYEDPTNGSLTINLKELVDDYPEQYIKIVNSQKKLIEKTLNNEIEVLRRDEVKQTNKPTLRIKLIFE